MSFGWEREAERALRVAEAVLHPLAPLAAPAAPGNPARAFETMLTSLLGVPAPEPEEASADVSSPAPSSAMSAFGAAPRPAVSPRRSATSANPALPAAWPAHGYEAPGITPARMANREHPLSIPSEIAGEVRGASTAVERVLSDIRRAEEWPQTARDLEAPASAQGYAPPAGPESAPRAAASVRGLDQPHEWSTATPAPHYASPEAPNPVADTRRGWLAAEEAAPAGRGATQPEVTSAPLRLAANAAELSAVLRAHVVPPPEEDSPLFAEPAITPRTVPGAAVPSQAVPAPSFTGTSAPGAAEGAWAAFEVAEPGPSGPLAEEMLVDRLLDRIQDRLRDESIRHFGLTGGRI
jgi:hypothetical protein